MRESARPFLFLAVFFRGRHTQPTRRKRDDIRSLVVCHPSDISWTVGGCMYVNNPPFPRETPEMPFSAAVTPDDSRSNLGGKFIKL